MPYITSTGRDSLHRSHAAPMQGVEFERPDLRGDPGSFAVPNKRLHTQGPDGSSSYIPNPFPTHPNALSPGPVFFPSASSSNSHNQKENQNQSNISPTKSGAGGGFARWANTFSLGRGTKQEDTQREEIVDVEMYSDSPLKNSNSTSTLSKPQSQQHLYSNDIEMSSPSQPQPSSTDNDAAINPAELRPISDNGVKREMKRREKEKERGKELGKGKSGNYGDGEGMGMGIGMGREIVLREEGGGGGDGENENDDAGDDTIDSDTATPSKTTLRSRSSLRSRFRPHTQSKPPHHLSHSTGFDVIAGRGADGGGARFQQFVYNNYAGQAHRNSDSAGAGTGGEGGGVVGFAQGVGGGRGGGQMIASGEVRRGPRLDAELPYTLIGYVQFIFNASITLMILSGLIWLGWTIWGDVKDLRKGYSVEILQEIATCTNLYLVNRCEPGGRIPAMESACQDWEHCMNRDPTIVSFTKVGAEVVAGVVGGFVDALSWRSLFALFALTPLVIILTNTTLLNVRRKHQPAPYPHPQHQQGYYPLQQQQNGWAGGMGQGQVPQQAGFHWPPLQQGQGMGGGGGEKKE